MPRFQSINYNNYVSLLFTNGDVKPSKKLH